MCTGGTACPAQCSHIDTITPHESSCCHTDRMLWHFDRSVLFFVTHRFSVRHGGRAPRRLRPDDWRINTPASMPASASAHSHRCHVPPLFRRPDTAPRRRGRRRSRIDHAFAVPRVRQSRAARASPVACVHPMRRVERQFSRACLSCRYSHVARRFEWIQPKKRKRVDIIKRMQPARRTRNYKLLYWRRTSTSALQSGLRQGTNKAACMR